MFSFGVERKGCVIIADEMGLGKTVQALGIARYFKNEWPLLIICPSSVKYSWRAVSFIFS
jgi:SWI/SNF-related matrix-associated actin-dependent regulator 1 of chromatin subfamily A